MRRGERASEVTPVCYDRKLKTARGVAPTAVFMGTVLLIFATVAAAAIYGRCLDYEGHQDDERCYNSPKGEYGAE